MKTKMNASDLATVKRLLAIYNEIGDNLAGRIKQTKESAEINARAEIEGAPPYLCYSSDYVERCVRDLMRESERHLKMLDKIRSVDEEVIYRGYNDVVDYINSQKPCTVFGYKAISEKKRAYVDNIYDLLKPHEAWYLNYESFCKDLWSYTDTEDFLTKIDSTYDCVYIGKLYTEINKTRSNYKWNHPYDGFKCCVNKVAKAICQVLLRSLMAPKIGFPALTGDKRKKPVCMTKEDISKAMDMIYIKATRKDGRLSKSYGDVIYRLVKFGNLGVGFLSWTKS